jgi:Skp family chaperone for outer membrane proteins
MTVRSLQSAFAVALILLFVTGLPMGLSARSAHAETKIAVVDVDAILASSKAAKSIKDQVDEKRKVFLKSVKEREDKLRAEQKEIEEKRADMSKDDLVSKAQDFEKRRIEARNTLQKEKSELDKSYSKAMNTLTDTITEVCQQIADEQEIDLIITRQNIIIGSKSLDITPDVMEYMNKKLPSLSLK